MDTLLCSGEVCLALTLMGMAFAGNAPRTGNVGNPSVVFFRGGGDGNQSGLSTVVKGSKKRNSLRLHTWVEICCAPSCSRCLRTNSGAIK